MFSSSIATSFSQELLSTVLSCSDPSRKQLWRSALIFSPSHPSTVGPHQYHMKLKLFFFPFKASSAHLAIYTERLAPGSSRPIHRHCLSQEATSAKTHTCNELLLNKCKSILLSFSKDTQPFLPWYRDKSTHQNCLPASFQLLGPSRYPMLYTQCIHCIGGGVRKGRENIVGTMCLHSSSHNRCFHT